tara:strand:- start:318 stop:629 length:312 start_codon:yes stop_codon:yes gene_type:complete
MVKYVKIIDSDSSKKKLKAIFYNDMKKKIKTIHFGSKGMKDYTLHSKDVADERKRLYIVRHKKKEDWTNPMTAGTLSRFILWNLPTRQASIKNYMNRFKLIPL